MYTIDREEGARMLEMSTRTIDRYIRSGKIRAKKHGKKVFLHEEDVRRFKNQGTGEHSTMHIVDDVQLEPVSQFVTKPLVVSYKELYEEARSLLDRKDQIIQDLSYRMGNMESELKNSIPMLEYKKATFLLESSQSKIEEEKKDMTDKVAKIESELKKEQTTNVTLIIVLALVLLISMFAWFVSV